MTDAEKTELKSKIKKIMIDHLSLVSDYPNTPPELILRELKNMWVKLEESGLLQPGMSFQQFAGHANNQFMIYQVNTMLGI